MAAPFQLPSGIRLNLEGNPSDEAVFQQINAALRAARRPPLSPQQQAIISRAYYAARPSFWETRTPADIGALLIEGANRRFADAQRRADYDELTGLRERRRTGTALSPQETQRLETLETEQMAQLERIPEGQRPGPMQWELDRLRTAEAQRERERDALLRRRADGETLNAADTARLQHLGALRLARLEAMGDRRNAAQTTEFEGLRDAARLAELRGMATRNPEQATELARLEAARLAHLQREQSAGRLRQPADLTELQQLTTAATAADGQLAAFRGLYDHAMANRNPLTVQQMTEMRRLEDGRLLRLQANPNRTAAENAELTQLQATIAQRQADTDREALLRRRASSEPLSQEDTARLRELDAARLRTLESMGDRRTAAQTTEFEGLRDAARLAELRRLQGIDPLQRPQAAELQRLEAARLAHLQREQAAGRLRQPADLTELQQLTALAGTRAPELATTVTRRPDAPVPTTRGFTYSSYQAQVVASLRGERPEVQLERAARLNAGALQRSNGYGTTVEERRAHQRYLLEHGFYQVNGQDIRTQPGYDAEHQTFNGRPIVDGNFGSQTRAAAVLMQRDVQAQSQAQLASLSAEERAAIERDRDVHRRSTDGVVGPRTAALLTRPTARPAVAPT